MRLTCSGDFGADVGAIPVTFRFKLPSHPDDVRKMHREFRGEDNLTRTLLELATERVQLLVSPVARHAVWRQLPKIDVSTAGGGSTEEVRAFVHNLAVRSAFECGGLR